jgi:Fe-S cluster biogenesis protein NfuA
MPKKLTTEQFIQKAREVHGDKYDYSLTKYIGRHYKLKIICPEHGEFEQVAGTHLNGSKCKLCPRKKSNTEKFIEKARKVHGDKYDYSLVEYIGCKDKVKIICPEHGVFEQVASNHLSGGCANCPRKKSTTEKFIKKAIKLHGDKYDYSLVNYISAVDKVQIICAEHGVFEQVASTHLSGSGCVKCSKNVITKKQFIEKAREVHGDKYDYSLVEYINSITKVKIICPEHGEFEHLPSPHLRGAAGCKKCSLYKRTRTAEQFIEKAREVHGDKYDYSMVEYIRSSTKVKIICPQHGEFEQTPRGHLCGGHGCNDCAQYSSWYNRAKRSKAFDSFKAYFVKCHDNNQAFYKIGVTYRELRLRFKHIPYKYEIINVKEIKDINDKEGARMIFGLESRFKKMYKNKKYTPKKEFEGMSECFSDKIN